jgi:hypothetical protein
LRAATALAARSACVTTIATALAARSACVTTIAIALAARSACALAARSACALVLVIGAAFLAGGCSGGSTTRILSGSELALQRSQLVLVAQGLESTAPAVAREVSAARAAWPQLAEGLPPHPSVSVRSLVSHAATLAAALPTPRFMANASRLTGPAAGLGGLYETFARLSERAWRLTESSIETVLAGPPAAMRFARANSSLYVHAVYDSHYDLSLLGKALEKGYARLGGAGTFAGKLTPARVSALAARYSIAATRLSPHPREATEGG